MLDFNKRKSSSKDQEDMPEQTAETYGDRAAQTSATARERPAGSTSARRDAAIIGPSIHIDGDLYGEEDLIIEGEVKGTVHLKKHGLTIGSQGKVTADVYANTISVEGFMEGDLYGAERISIRKTAVVRGNVTSPRVSLEEGARFRGSIEMESEALKKVFAEAAGSARSGTQPSPSLGRETPAPASGSSLGSGSGSPVAAAKANTGASGSSVG